MLRRSLLLVLLICVTAAAQKGQISAKLVTIRVLGTERYTEPEVIATLGLKVGQTTNPSDFKAAADKLLDSGAFQTVGYEYEPAGTGYKVTFKVQDEPRWIKASYGNFLWFPRDELDKAIRDRVPLYRGELPIDGSMTDTASSALQQLIQKRGIPGTVRFLHTAKLSGPVTGGKFLIDGVDLKITRVDVTGAGPEQKPVETAAARLLNTNYDQDEANSMAQLNILPVAQRDGYIRAKVGVVDAKLSDPDPQHPAVTVTVPITLGDQYTLSDIVVSGNQVFPPDEIRKQIKVKNGAVANDVQIHDDLDQVKKLYGTRGYLMAQATADAQPDDASHTVVYQLRVKEGEQFHMGTLQISGVNPEGTTKLTNMWKLKPGDPYSSEYIREYMREITPLIPRSVEVKVSPRMNMQAKVVDVGLQFVPRKVVQ